MKKKFHRDRFKKKIQFDFSWYSSQNLKGTYREKSFYLPNWLRERSSGKRGEELREQVLSLKNRLVTWNVFVHSKVSYKWSSIVAPQLLQSKSLPQFQWNYTAKPISFTPPPIFVHFGWKFSDRNSKFFAIIRVDVSSNCKQESQENIVQSGVGPLWKLNRCPRFLLIQKTLPRTRDSAASFFTAKSFLPFSRARSNYSWIELFLQKIFSIFSFNISFKTDDSYYEGNFSLSLLRVKNRLRLFTKIFSSHVRMLLGYCFDGEVERLRFSVSISCHG